MSVVEELLRLGGVATRSALIAATSRPEVDAALRTGEVTRLARGRYALPQADEARSRAHALTGVMCLLSAALHHGWAVKHPPDRPQVALPRNRKVPSDVVGSVEIRRLRLAPDDVVDGATSKDRTLLDCLRALPFDEALAVADSALRDGYPHKRLEAVARDARGPDSVRARRVARVATALAANPFESVLRAIAMTVAGLSVRPQVSLYRRNDSVVGGRTFLGRPDLVDEQLRIVLEADSFEWHGGRTALRSDALRYNGLVVDGWLVLRFTWEDVMFDSSAVRVMLERAVAERTDQLCAVCGAAS
ncbi:type IV toxin-antitoxin system AbiEi family antitoxin domain-containing protein [Georgenia halophila]|uniref:Type IV toxin-antitoxin system AbiEi family antitoxin domain-containing protein n=1 Tax=Georgenia halophila TaxID=620889 RepID=A0ABP8KVS1_9MICO